MAHYRPILNVLASECINNNFPPPRLSCVATLPKNTLTTVFTHEHLSTVSVLMSIVSDQPSLFRFVLSNYLDKYTVYQKIEF